MNISFAKLGHEECERCIFYNEHSCEADAVGGEWHCLNPEGPKKTAMCLCCKRKVLHESKKRNERKSLDNKCLCVCCKHYLELQEKRNEERKKCEVCCSYKMHIERAGLARACYKADASSFEKKTAPDTYFAYLDLQKVRMLPEIAGVKSAVFTQRIYAYNEIFSPLGKKTRKSVAIFWHQGIASRNDKDITS